jgi:hypothetical protein
MKTVQDLIKASGLPIVSASLKKMDFGDKNIHFPSLKRGWETYTKQIIAALENSTTDVVFFCEHDVLYHPSHFLFTPPKRDTFYYNDNVWMLRASDGHALHYDVNQVSGLCVYRDIALEHFRERLEIIQRDGFSRDMGFEPMTHGRIHYKKTWPMATWKSDYPNVDVKHGKNGTGQRWTKEEFRNKKYTRNWIETEGYNIEGWNDLQAII